MNTSELITIVVAILCTSPIYLLIFGQLRYVRAMHDKLVTETLNFEEEIKYEQINYIYQSALIKPVFIRISYNDQESEKNSKILCTRKSE